MFPQKNKTTGEEDLIKSEKESEGQKIIKSLKNLNNGLTAAEHSDEIQFKIFKGGDNVKLKDVEEYENKLFFIQNMKQKSFLIKIWQNSKRQKIKKFVF